jgi:NAD(P)H-flavin reductase
LKVLERVEQIEHRTAPTGKFSDEDYVDIEGLRQCKDLLAFGAPAVLTASEDCHDVTVGAIDRVILNRYSKLDGFRAFVCGDPALVQALKKKSFLSGIPMRDIHFDAFLPSP